MPGYADILRLASRRPNLPPATPPAEDAGFLSMLWEPARQALKGMAWVDEKTRRAIASATGYDTAGDDEISGDDLLKHVFGLDLGKNTEGKIEWRDVPGFATEVLASPFNLIPVGQLTKGGQIAARGSKLLERAKALRRIGTPDKLAEARTLLPAIREVSQAARAAKAEKLLAPTWAGQGRAGQRALLGLEVPGIMQNRALLTATPALGGLGAVGRGIRRMAEPLAKFNRVGARMRPGAAVEIGGRRLSGEDFNALVEAGEDAMRGGRGAGGEQRELIARRLAGFDADRARRALDELRAEIPRKAENALEQHHTIRALKRAADRAEEAGDWDRADRLGDRIDRARRALRRQYDLTPRAGRDDRLTALVAGVEQQGVEAKLAERAAAEARAVETKITLWESRRSNALADENKRAAGTAQAQITRLNQKLSDLADEYRARGELHRTVLTKLPEEVQAEAARIAEVTGRALEHERLVGVPVSELSDSLLGYMHRAMTPEGLKFARKLDELRLKTPFARYGRQIKPSDKFTARRSAAFEGMGVMRINDWARNLADKLRREGIDVEFGSADEFFLENPAEAVARRLAAGGRARSKAEVLGGVVNGLNIPQSAARAGDVPVAEFLEASGLRRLRGDQPVPKSAGAIDAALAGTPWEGRYIPREFAAEALKVNKLLDTPEELEQIAGFFDGYNSMMRFWVTVPFPAYHARNAMSNVWMCWMAGMRNPALFAKAGAVQRRAAAALKRGALDGPDLAIMRRMTEFGAQGGGLTGELADLLAQHATPGAAKKGGLAGRTWRGVTKPGETAAGRRILTGSSAIENNAKVALYLDGLQRGLSEYEAGLRVKKWLFDYGALGKLDQRVRKWAYFWTFFRKNLPLQIENLFAQTPKMHLWAKAAGHFDEDNEQMLAEYQRSRSPIKAGLTDAGERRYLQVGMPFDDLFTVSGEGRPGLAGAMRIGQKLWGLGGPAARALPEALTGQGLSSGRPTTAGKIALSLTPANRVVTTLKRIGDVAAGERPAEDLAALAGATPLRVDPRRAPAKKQLQAINARLEALALAGRAKPFTGYGPTYGASPEEIAELKSWLRARRRLESITSRKQKKRAVSDEYEWKR